MPLDEKLLELGKFLEQELITELLQQDHKATGKLIDSIESRLESIVNGKQLQIWFEGYGRFMETGVPANKIPFTAVDRSNPRGGYSKYIGSIEKKEGLINWAHVKFGLDAKKAKGMAFAIAHKHIKFGMPLGGEKFMRFVSKTLDKNQFKIEDEIEKAVDNTVNVIVDNLITKVQSKFNTIK